MDTATEITFEACWRRWTDAQLDLQVAKSRLDAALFLLRHAPSQETQQILDDALRARDNARRNMNSMMNMVWSRFGMASSASLAAPRDGALPGS